MPLCRCFVCHNAPVQNTVCRGLNDEERQEWIDAARAAVEVSKTQVKTATEIARIKDALTNWRAGEAPTSSQDKQSAHYHARKTFRCLVRACITVPSHRFRNAE